MSVQTVRAWGRDLDGQPYLNEDGSLDIVDAEAVDLALILLGYPNTITVVGGEPFGTTPNPARDRAREEFVRALLDDAGISSSADATAEEVREIITGQLG